MKHFTLVPAILLRSHHLQGDESISLGVVGLINDTHASSTDHFADLVGANLRSDRGFVRHAFVGTDKRCRGGYVIRRQESRVFSCIIRCEHLSNLLSQRWGDRLEFSKTLRPSVMLQR